MRFWHSEQRHLSGHRPRFGWAGALLLLCAVTATGFAPAETCTTQSQMPQADRDSIVAAVRRLAGKVQANDASGLRAETVPEYAKDFAAMSALVAATAPKVAGAQFSIDQLYLLDAAGLKTLADGTNQDAQFFCTLNKSPAEVDFLIPALPPGRYAFAVATAPGATPWRLSFLLRDSKTSPDQWAMAGFYPKQLTAAGHDGIWYWTRAREMVKAKQLWTAYLYYQEAQALLQPVGFLVSTHLEKLRKEAASSAPPALSEGIGAETPLVVKGAQNSEYRFTALTTDDSLGADKIDIVVHLAPEPQADAPSGTASPSGSAGAKKDPPKAAPPPPLSPRERNAAAMAALVNAFPELRTAFHGIWVFADEPGKNPFVTEEPMANIH